MTTATQSLILELDAALSKASNFRQLEILRSITDLFILGADSYSEDQVAIFDDVITRLIERMDQRSLSELSARLAVTSITLAVIANIAFKIGLVLVVGGRGLARRAAPGLIAIGVGLTAGLMLLR